MFDKKKVLATGATGCIASLLLPVFKERYEVFLPDNGNRAEGRWANLVEYCIFIHYLLPGPSFKPDIAFENEASVEAEFSKPWQAANVISGLTSRLFCHRDRSGGIPRYS